MDPFGIDSIWLLVAFWTGVASAIASSVLMVVAYVFHRRGRAARQREEAFVAQWQHIFSQSSLPEELPALDDSQRFAFLRLWTHAFETTSPSDPATRERLRRLGQRMNLGSIALALLRDPSHRTRIAATLALGYLKEERARFTLENFALSGDGHLAPTAMLSLLRLAPRRAEPLLTEALCTGFQWNGQATARVLEEAGDSFLQALLQRAVWECTTEETIFLFRNLRRAKHPAAQKLAARVGNRAMWDHHLIDQVRQSEAPAALSRHATLVEEYLMENTLRLRLLEALADGAVDAPNKRLQPLLESPSAWVREQAYRSLPKHAATLLRGAFAPPEKS